MPRSWRASRLPPAPAASPQPATAARRRSALSRGPVRTRQPSPCSVSSPRSAGPSPTSPAWRRPAPPSASPSRCARPSRDTRRLSARSSRPTAGGGKGRGRGDRHDLLGPPLSQPRPLPPAWALGGGGLEEYERVVALPQEAYRTESDISSLKAQEYSLEGTLGRLRATSERFDRDLAEVYHDPATARQRFLAAAAELGSQPAAERMREQPERFGALRTVDRSRALGLWVTPDDTAARASARATATAGHEFVDAHG